MERVTVIGAGLAGVEAAHTLSQNGIAVTLLEQKPEKRSPAHKSDGFAELVCSNSLKAERIDSAAGLLKEEMRLSGSLCIESALLCKVPAGGALAVDRDKFSEYITQKIKADPLIEIEYGEVTSIPSDGYVIVATGPLTDGALSEDIRRLLGEEYLNFFDAAAPIVTKESIDFNKAFYAARYGRGTDDYINCPMTKEKYTAFREALISAEAVILKDFDKPLTVYEGCMPIEILAARGEDAPRFGPMKPVGLTDPVTGKRPYAVVQLRAENESASMYNLVGFQTNLKFSEQKRVFSMIPGLENAEFLRYGVMHRNSFINSPKLLNSDFSLRKNGKIAFAGQISGVEGYMESAASGIIAAKGFVAKIKGYEKTDYPKYTMFGALSNYVSDETVKNFQPMGANFGVLPPLDEKIKDKRERYGKLSERALKWYRGE